MLFTSKMDSLDVEANSTGTSIECANKKDLAPEECGQRGKRKFQEKTKVQYVLVYLRSAVWVCDADRVSGAEILPLRLAECMDMQDPASSKTVDVSPVMLDAGEGLEAGCSLPGVTCDYRVPPM
jgi:hypothetical protein